MNDFRRSYFQFSWVIKWLLLYQAIIQFFHEISGDGHNDSLTFSDSFQYDPSWIYSFFFLFSQLHGGTITEILKTALEGFDLLVVTVALTECPESPIAEEKIDPVGTYDHESRHYHFCARAYDPFMGRFLQTDPLGYADSMNLYQAFNMNPFNFTDPMGLKTVIKERFRAEGGPSTSEGSDLYSKTSTKSGEFRVAGSFAYSNPSSRWAWSRIPWGAPLKVDENKDVFAKINGKWTKTTDISSGLTYEALKQAYKDYYNRDEFPSQYLFNDFGHKTIAYYSDKNKNGVRDNGEKIENDMIHTTPPGEGEAAQGVSNDDIILGESHGCIHVTPADIDRIVGKKYATPNNKVIIHKYNELIPNWSFNSAVGAPFTIHFFPGVKTIVITGDDGE